MRTVAVKKSFKKKKRGRRRKIAVLLMIFIIAITLGIFLTNRIEPEPCPSTQAMSPTVYRANSMQRDISRYSEARATNMEIDVIEERASRVMSAFRHQMGPDFMMAMASEYISGEWDMEYLLILIGSRVAAARSAGDDRYEEALENAVDSRLQHEIEKHMLQRILASIEYFENQ